MYDQLNPKTQKALIKFNNTLKTLIGAANSYDCDGDDELHATDTLFFFLFLFVFNDLFYR